MQQSVTNLPNRVECNIPCNTCKGYTYLHGKTPAGKQRYKCKKCNSTFINKYSYQSYEVSDRQIISLLKEGCGIRSIARLLYICCGTVLKRILSIAKSIVKPVIAMNKAYEVDEMRTYYKNKGRLLWIVYALQRETNQVVDFAVGSRTKATLQKVISTLLLSNAKKIYTDKLNLYSFLIPSYLHINKRYSTNRIERKNLSMRTHLKRLTRRTICYNKSIAMLSACLKIYFWSGNRR
jgi:insertion element IS1 protein InsB